MPRRGRRAVADAARDARERELAAPRGLGLGLGRRAVLARAGRVQPLAVLRRGQPRDRTLVGRQLAGRRRVVLG